MKIGIICGHVINELLDDIQEVTVDTPYGNVHLMTGNIGIHQVFFLNRHGKQSNLPPHKVNYKANIHALYASHVDCVVSIGTVGSMTSMMSPGDAVIPHDFLDFTCSRSVSFFDDKRVHVDMAHPFCPNLRSKLIETCKRHSNITLHQRGVYVATEGPRLETESEIRFFATIGEIVGMTLVPEVVLAREKGLCFASLCLVCNMAAGLQQKLPVDEIKQIFTEKESDISHIVKETISSLTLESDCKCKQKSVDALL